MTCPGTSPIPTCATTARCSSWITSRRTYQYTYLIHLSTRGTFHTLPTHIQESYFPEVFGVATEASSP